ncbi:hypothetical protein THAOC_07345 [Thalassiosira oceanica]|uniref:Uncharacterized protein n=1 Tax=Thalassiosira oceanica TaxID=159749 RepID=K0T0M0_THAOC|nr:hypothetical protein THAOC_07345 [Thalassiosira oceanica]|eukprot:EJK71240.1 hypothetical protein THAOC_07345 [Thalassiosira oceanica]
MQPRAISGQPSPHSGQYGQKGGRIPHHHQQFLRAVGRGDGRNNRQRGPQTEQDTRMHYLRSTKREAAYAANTNHSLIVKLTDGLGLVAEAMLSLDLLPNLPTEEEDVPSPSSDNVSLSSSTIALHAYSCGSHPITVRFTRDAGVDGSTILHHGNVRGAVGVTPVGGAGRTDGRSPGVIKGRTQDTAGAAAAVVAMEDLLPGEHVARQRWIVQRTGRTALSSTIKPSEAC